MFGALTTLVYGLITDELHYAPAVPGGNSLYGLYHLDGRSLRHGFLEPRRQDGRGQPGRRFLNIMPLVGVAAGVIVLDEDFTGECFGAGGILSGVYLLTQARQILHRRNVRRRAHYRAARQRMQA